MKEITIKTLANPIDFAVKMYEATENIANLLDIRYSDNAGDTVAKMLSIDCRLYNIEHANVSKFAKRLTVAFYQQKVDSLDSDIKKVNIQMLTASADKMMKLRRKADKLSAVLDDYTVLVGKLHLTEDDLKPCNFASIVASAITGQSVAGIAVQPVLDALKNDKDGEETNKKHTIEVINAMLHSVSGLSDGFVRDFTINCNVALYRNIKAVYYRGRKLSVDGHIIQKYDEKGRNVRQEVLLAIVDHLQRKQATKEEEQSWSKQAEAEAEKQARADKTAKQREKKEAEKKAEAK